MDFHVQFADIHGNLREGLYLYTCISSSLQQYLVFMTSVVEFLLQDISSLHITKTSPCNEDPYLTPHFYKVKLGLTGVFIFSYFCSKT